MDTRSIYYINEKEDPLSIEVELALSRSMEKNFEAYCEAIIANYAMMNIDVVNYPVKRDIYYKDDE